MMKVTNPDDLARFSLGIDRMVAVHKEMSMLAREKRIQFAVEASEYTPFNANELRGLLAVALDRLAFPS